MGLSSTTFIVSIQNHVNWNVRGVATSLNMFMRIVGSAVGAALLGGILNLQMRAFIGTESKSLDVSNIDLLLDENRRESMDTEMLEKIQNGLSFGLDHVFNGLFIIGILAFLIILFFPNVQLEKAEES